MADSNKIDRSTGVLIKKPYVIMDYSVMMVGVNLVSQVSIPYSLQQGGVKCYRKIAEMYFGILLVYNSFILWKKMNPDKQNVDHLNY